MNIRFSKLKTIIWAFLGLSSLIFLFFLILTTSNFTSAVSNNQGLSGGQLEEFAQNNILFYNPAECIGGTSSGLCGSNIEEKVWSILRQTLDPLHAAAAFGSIVHEGSFQPVKWEHYKIADPTTGEWMPGVTWNDIYNGVYDGRRGVGSFGLTSGLSDYLHYVNDKAPDLLQYFKDPSNTIYATGDDLAEKIGQDTVDRLIELEVNYFINEWIPKYKGQGIYDKFLGLTDIEAAAVCWAHDIEVCADCGYDAGSSGLVKRAAAAKGYYEKYKNFTCTAKSSGKSSGGSNSGGANSSSNTGIKWDNGWLVEESMEGAVKQDVNGKTDLGEAVSPIGSYTTSDGKPDKILLHNTQELGEGYNVYPAGNKFPAHFTIDLRNKKVWQHFSIYQPSLAVATYDKSGPIQIEIIGYTKRATKKSDGTFEYTEPAGYKSEWDLFNFKDEDWDYLAKLLLAISEETGIPLTSSVEWTPGTKNGLSREQFLNYKGVLGHMHTPDNGSEDPSDIWQYVEAAINRQSNKCTTYKGEYPEYMQWDEPWGNLPYHNGYYKDSACGAASMAMLATVATGKDIFPNDIGDFLEKQEIPEGKYYDSTSITVLDPIVGEHYGFEVVSETYSDVADAEEKIRKYLKDGYMIHLTGKGTDFFGPNGHVIGIFDIDNNDNVMLANPGWTGNGKVPLKDVASHLMWGVFTAIKGNNSSKNNCDNLCNNKNSSVGADGLTEEQAQKVAHYYNTQYTPRGCCGLTNCVEFSNFFVSELTTKGTPGGYSVSGDGREVAPNLIANGQAEGGTEPKIWAVFSKTSGNHTGVVVGANSDGTYITVEAAWPGWSDGYMDGNGNGRVYTDKTFTDGTYKFAYFANSLNSSKLQEILNK